jgi:hypothetical protein
MDGDACGTACGYCGRCSNEPDGAICSDCGESFYRSEFDSCVWCGPCAQRRDDWITAQEIKRMAKAVWNADLTKVKDIA